jgi:hypothetical protein
MKKLEVLEIERSDLVKKHFEDGRRPIWRLSDEAEQTMWGADMVVFSGQIIKNRAGRITASLRDMLENW